MVLLDFVNRKAPRVFVCCSWEEEVQMLGFIHNDQKSMWLVGESQGEIHIGFIVSFAQLISK